MNQVAYMINVVALFVYLLGAEVEGAVAQDRPHGRLTFCCEANNDLYSILAACEGKSERYEAPHSAIIAAAPESAVLILADEYPARRTKVSADAIAAAAAKRLRLYIEYPEAIPGVELGEPRKVRWERGVVASESIRLGLPPLQLLALHDCQFIPAKATDPALVLARVAGFDTAVYGLPQEAYPVLFRTEQGFIVTTTKLSDFIKARYAPSADWIVLWRHLLDELDPHRAPHAIEATPIVSPAYGKDESLPADAERLSLSRLTDWYKNSHLLMTAEREKEISQLLIAGQETAPLPADPEAGDGTSPPEEVALMRHARPAPHALLFANPTLTHTPTLTRIASSRPLPRPLSDSRAPLLRAFA